jgi:hypothetical protein
MLHESKHEEDADKIEVGRAHAWDLQQLQYYRQKAWAKTGLYSKETAEDGACGREQLHDNRAKQSESGEMVVGQGDDEQRRQLRQQQRHQQRHLQQIKRQEIMRLQQQQLQQREMAFRESKRVVRGNSKRRPYAAYAHHGSGDHGDGAGGTFPTQPLKSLFPNPAVASVIKTTADNRAGSHPPWENGLRKTDRQQWQQPSTGESVAGGTKVRTKGRKHVV